MELVYAVRDIGTAAAELWRIIKDQSVISFEGELGAGKTTLIQAICKHIGVEGRLVSSPSFSIINQYSSASGAIYHIDLYRCRDEEEAIRAGVEECLYSGHKCFVEWPSRAAGIFPPSTVEISIDEVDSHTRRIIVNR